MRGRVGGLLTDAQMSISISTSRKASDLFTHLYKAGWPPALVKETSAMVLTPDCGVLITIRRVVRGCMPFQKATVPTIVVWSACFVISGLVTIHDSLYTLETSGGEPGTVILFS